MDDERLHLAGWDWLTSAERAAGARVVAGRLPAPWRLVGLEWHALGDQRHEVAFFDWQGVEFALIPGGAVTLGYDRDRGLTPMQFGLSEDPAYYAKFPDLDAFLEPKPGQPLRHYLTPFRIVHLTAFLLQVRATDVYDEGNRGLVTAPVLQHPDHHELEAYLAQAGFRLPTTDEWEHGCAAGSRTLWRWGDTYPPHRPPVRDTFRDEAVGDWNWNEHNKPNAFGLEFSSSPWEISAESGVRHNGDGGESSQGGWFLDNWLSLASSYIHHWPYQRLLGHFRRAYTIP